MPRAARPRVATSATRRASSIATRKGLWTLASDASRRSWKLSPPTFLGHIVHHARARPARRQDAARRGAHRPSGPDGVPFPRRRPHVEGSDRGRRRSRPTADAWSITRSGSRRGTRRSRACGTPARRRKACSVGRRRRDVEGRRRLQRASAAQGVVRRRPGRHARRPEAAFDHRRPARSRAPVHRDVERRRVRVGRCRRTTGSRSTRACAAMFLPMPDPEYGHDPHCVRLPSNPDRLYQQNHCGIYRLDRPATRWMRIGDDMPKSVGDIGFPMVSHPYDPETRVGVSDGRHRRLAAHLAGRQARGVPHARRRQDVEAPGRRHADVAGLVDGQAAGDDRRPFTIRGRLLRHDVGRGLGQPRRGPQRGSCLAEHLPEIYAVEAA